MSRTYLRQHGKSSIELIEESFHLLRAAAPGTLATYFTGSVPFVAASLFFWTDMSRSAFAAQRLPEASLVLALLFLWMKFFQARFARLLHAQLCGGPPPAWSLKNSARSLAVQAVLQSSALFVLPVAAFTLLPFAWVFAFYQNVTALDDGEKDLKPVFEQARQAAARWPRQNHAILLTLSGLGFFVLLNWVSFCFLTPQLLNTLLGVESVFSRSPMSMLNTTFLAAMFGLTYLCLDPLAKTCYVLRCFYANSVCSGDDLRAELRLISRVIPTFIMWLALCVGSESTFASEPSAPSGHAPPGADLRTSVSPKELDRAISQVIQQTKYTWRMPREKKTPETEDGLLVKFFGQIRDMIDSALRAVLNALWSLIDWLLPGSRHPETEPRNGWIALQQGILIFALATVTCAFAIFMLRLLRARRTTEPAIESVALPFAPDLADENLRADQLPEKSWTKLAGEFVERGELRLALRALFLASLSHLATSGLITIGRSKSNHDYERELQRRAHAFPGLVPLFHENVRIFDRVWYGLHEVSVEAIERFAANVERIKAAA